MSGQIPTPSPSAPATGGTPVRYCKKCGYALCGLQSPRCPECGRGFDLADLRSTRKKPLKRWTRWVWRAGYALLAVVLVLAAAWGWLYWDWRLEQRAIAELKLDVLGVNPRLPHWLDKADHSHASWLRDHAGPAGFVLDRVTDVGVYGSPSIGEGEPTDLSTLVHLGRLERLDIRRTGVSDLSPLAHLTDLGELIVGGSFTDVSPLAQLRSLHDLGLSGTPELKDLKGLSGLTNLQSMTISGAPVSDVSPLAGLTNLRWLMLDATRVSDLRPLAHLTKLESLFLINGTPVDDLSPLAAIKGLRVLGFSNVLSVDQIDAVQRSMPGCILIPQ